MTIPRDWAAIEAQLAAPFDPEVVDFRPQGKLSEKGNGRAIAYIDARAVAERLDAIFGPQGWAFSWEPLILDNAVRVVRATLTIDGVSKSDIGDADKTEPSKAAVSDGLKRAAVLWGIGRYLYRLDSGWVKGERVGAAGSDNWIIPDAELARLRSKLPRPGSAPAPATAPRPASVTVAAPTPAALPPESAARIKSACAALGWGKNDAMRYLAQFGVKGFSELTAEQLAEVIPDLESKAGDVQGAHLDDADGENI